MNVIEKAFLAGRSVQSWHSFQMDNITYFNSQEASSCYANFIASNPSDKDVVEFNTRILTKWSNSGLARIKARAWRIRKDIYAASGSLPCPPNCPKEEN